MANQDVAIEIQPAAPPPVLALPGPGADVVVAVDYAPILPVVAVPQPVVAVPQPAGLVVTWERPAGAWTCELCTFDNKPKRRRCEMCDTPRPAHYQDNERDSEDKDDSGREEKVSPVHLMAQEKKWHEAPYNAQSLQRVGNQMIMKILDFCDPGDIVAVGLTGRWWQTVATRAELWSNLFVRDHEHFLDEFPENTKLMASALLESAVTSSRITLTRPGWERNGGGVRAYNHVLQELRRRCERQEQEIERQKIDNKVKVHESRTEDLLDSIWAIIVLGAVLFVITLILLIVKLVYPDSMTWAAVLGPLAAGFACHSLYLNAGAIYSIIACCLFPRRLCCSTDWVGQGLFWMGLISIPWAAFPVLLILEIQEIITWSYSFIFLSLYLALVGAAVFWVIWLYIDNGGYCSSSLCFPITVAYCVLALFLGFFIPLGLKVDGVYDPMWALVFTSVWIILLAVVIISIIATVEFIRDEEYLKLLFWAPIADLIVQCIMVSLRLDFPDLCPWLYALMPLILFFCVAAAACCIATGLVIYDR